MRLAVLLLLTSCAPRPCDDVLEQQKQAVDYLKKEAWTPDCIHNPWPDCLRRP